VYFFNIRSMSDRSCRIDFRTSGGGSSDAEIFFRTKMLPLQPDLWQLHSELYLPGGHPMLAFLQMF
jgi:hypothetical protein